MGDVEEQQLPSDVQAALKDWRRSFMTSTLVYYLAGIVGTLASVISAGYPTTLWNGDIVPRLSALVSAACFAVLGYVRPERNYTKFVMAWRILNIAAIRYKAGQIDRKALFDALENGENAIAKLEQTNDQTDRKRPKADKGTAS